MQRDEILIELYKAHLKSKDAFTDRTFTLNRFYLGIVLILIIAGVFYIIDNNPFLAIPVSVVGIVVSMLWWFNQDAYNQQIKIKYINVLEKMEEEFPFQPLKGEYEAVVEQTKKGKLSIFPETLKFFSASTFFIFVIMCLVAFIPILLAYFQ